MIIDRSDNVMDLCEMKYSKNEYVINEEYAKHVLEREEFFRRKAKTKKALRCTFITTYGVKKNAHSDIVDNEIKVEELFV